ncbi:MAG: hypothetical protein AVDCRST_MAG90-1320, partial [uncultured Microvirga sp.]
WRKATGSPASTSPTPTPTRNTCRSTASPSPNTGAVSWCGAAGSRPRSAPAGPATSSS